MKITNIECTVIYAKRRGAFGGVARTALGAASVSEHAVVRVDTDAGVCGIGEVCSVFAKKGRDYAKEIEETFFSAAANRCRSVSDHPPANHHGNAVAGLPAGPCRH